MVLHKGKKVKKKIVVAVTGASGSIYGLSLLKVLLNNPIDVFLVVSDAGKTVMQYETAYNGELLEKFVLSQCKNVHKDAKLYESKVSDLSASFASGSFICDGMVVAPCSMKSLGAIAHGISDGLILRAADVCLKEKRPLILLTRETPLSLIHLKNMCSAAVAGATIMPPCPGFYLNPKTVDDLVNIVVARILDHLKIPHQLADSWKSK
jgi:4-hydroxy-3-polyprenylbenzoate decarboxylase